MSKSANLEFYTVILGDYNCDVFGNTVITLNNVMKVLEKRFCCCCE